MEIGAIPCFGWVVLAGELLNPHIYWGLGQALGELCAVGMLLYRTQLALTTLRRFLKSMKNTLSRQQRKEFTHKLVNTKKRSDGTTAVPYPKFLDVLPVIILHT